MWRNGFHNNGLHFLPSVSLHQPPSWIAVSLRRTFVQTRVCLRVVPLYFTYVGCRCRIRRRTRTTQLIDPRRTSYSFSYPGLNLFHSHVPLPSKDPEPVFSLSVHSPDPYSSFGIGYSFVPSEVKRWRVDRTGVGSRTTMSREQTWGLAKDSLSFIVW